jgi:hypothetical protein
VISPAALATEGRQPDNVALDVRPACQMIRSGFPLSKDPFCRRRSIAARTSALVNPPGGDDERVAGFVSDADAVGSSSCFSFFT